MATFKAWLPVERQALQFVEELRALLRGELQLERDVRLDVAGVATPRLSFGGHAINGDLGLVDGFTAATGGVVATIFACDGDDFVRITTSVRKPDGGRPLGTQLDRAHPAWEALRRDTAYSGYANLFGVQYLTHYRPLHDARGAMIGVLFIGIDVSRLSHVSVLVKAALLAGAAGGLLFAGAGALFAGLLGSTPGAQAAAALRPYFIFGGLAAALLPAGLVLLYLRSALGSALAAAMQGAKQLAAGDLTRQIHVGRRDEMGALMQSINGIAQSFALLVGNVRKGSDQIHQASAEIAAGNADLATRTEEQAGMLDRSVGNISSLTMAVQDNATHAQDANSLVQGAEAIAARAGAAVEGVVGRMDGIKGSAHRITDIIATIEGIAFQTNILALNAAVEAARAGEQGRGFAVVAGEVRSLAQRASAAAKEIRHLIEATVQGVDEGCARAADAGATMAEVVEVVQRVVGLMDEITRATVEQSARIAEVEQAMTHMDRSTQQNATLVEEAAAAAERMFRQAEALSTAVAAFKVAQAAAPAAGGGDGRR